MKEKGFPKRFFFFKLREKGKRVFEKKMFFLDIHKTTKDLAERRYFSNLLAEIKYILFKRINFH